MTVTPKIDPRKDRKQPPKKAPRLAAIYSLWAIVALGALSAAGSVYIWRDGRAPVALPPMAMTPATPQIVADPKSEREINRLNDAVRVLASERDRLATRLEQLERSVGDITATIPQQKKAPPVVADEPFAPPPAPSVQVMTPPNPEPRPQGPNQLMPQQQKQTTTTVVPVVPPVVSNEVAPPPTPDNTNTTRTEFGVDLGGEKTVDGLRARWATLRGNHGSTLDGLRPLISVKEGQKSGTVELRLVAGPVANAAAAARICARLQTNAVPCIPTVFDGQRLSLR